MNPKRFILLLTAFHRPLLLPTLSMAVAIGIAGYFMLWSAPIIEGTGYGYMFAGPVIHYLIYNTMHPYEYYFYYNAGLSKPGLYMSTIFMNVIIGSFILLYA